MLALFGFLYLFLFLGIVLTSLFILYHIHHYALNRRVASLAITIFLTVTVVLLWANAVLFFHLPLDKLLPGSGNAPAWGQNKIL